MQFEVCFNRNKKNFSTQNKENEIQTTYCSQKSDAKLTFIKLATMPRNRVKIS